MTKTKKDNNLTKRLNEARNSVSDFLGVYVDIVKVRQNSERIFKARIGHQGVYHSLGYYDNAVDAAKAYNKKAKALLGGEKKAKASGRWNMI